MDEIRFYGKTADASIALNRGGIDLQVRLGDDSDWICLFRPDGTIEINPKYTVDEAAREFWKAVLLHAKI